MMIDVMKLSVFFCSTLDVKFRVRKEFLKMHLHLHLFGIDH